MIDVLGPEKRRRVATRFSALSRGGVYYAFLFQSQPVFQDFSLQPNRLFV